jgi:hypothetical protein
MIGPSRMPSSRLLGAVAIETIEELLAQLLQRLADRTRAVAIAIDGAVRRVAPARRRRDPCPARRPGYPAMRWPSRAQADRGRAGARRQDRRSRLAEGAEVPRGSPASRSRADLTRHSDRGTRPDACARAAPVGSGPRALSVRSNPVRASAHERAPPPKADLLEHAHGGVNVVQAFLTERLLTTAAAFLVRAHRLDLLAILER